MLGTDNSATLKRHPNVDKSQNKNTFSPLGVAKRTSSSYFILEQPRPHDLHAN